MRILFVTDLYPVGNENVSLALFNFIQEWHKEGHLVNVIRPNFILNAKIRNRKIIKEKVYNEFGIKIFNLNFVTPFLFNVRKKLPKDFSLKNYDIMISHMPSGALMAQRLLEKEKIKYVCSVHASDIVVLKDIKYLIYFRNKLKQSYLSSDKIAARSPILQQKIEQIMPEIQDKTFVAYSGTDRNCISEENIKKIDYKNIKICTAASLKKRKNIDIIIKALSQTDINFKFTVMGDGKEKKNLKIIAKKFGLEDKIEFRGKLTRDEVFNEMKKNDIFILLSDYETFGLVYLEALSAGNIIIAKKNDGIDGILKDGQNSFLINPKSDELIKCLNKILNLKETEIEKIKKNAIETVKKMTLENAAKNYLENIIIPE